MQQSESSASFEEPNCSDIGTIDWLTRTLLLLTFLDFISGRSRDDLEAWFGIYPFRLIAEHGASRRQPGALIWEELDRTVNYAWKKELLNILRLYEEATPG